MTMNESLSEMRKKNGQRGGLRGGLSKSQSKVEASRQNGRKPCAPGKKRGRPSRKSITL